MQESEKPKYTWSYSSISLFKQCPQKYYRLRVVKDITEPEAEHLRYGTAVHEAAEKYVRDNEPIPEKFKFIQKYIDPLLKIEGQKLCEFKMALTRDFKPCEFFHPTAWWRGIADLLILCDDKAYIVDYKTGKSSKYADVKQLELLSLAVFKHFPEIKRVKAGLLFFVADDFVKADFENMWQSQYWSGWMETINRLEVAYDKNVWNASPNFTCRNFCPVTDCLHNGKFR